MCTPSISSVKMVLFLGFLIQIPAATAWLTAASTNSGQHLQWPAPTSAEFSGLTLRMMPKFNTGRFQSSTSLNYINERNGGGPSDADLLRLAADQQAARRRGGNPLEEPEQQQEEGSDVSYKEPRRSRASIEGVSIAPDGFYVVLRTNVDEYLPLRVTVDPADAQAATSPEALTLIQLMSGVDMAGAMLPPDLLAQLVVLECERFLEERNKQGIFLQDDAVVVAQDILKEVQASLPKDQPRYSEAHDWIRARATLPQVSVDEIIMTQGASSVLDDDDHDSTWTYVWNCQVRSLGRSFKLHVTGDLLEEVLYHYYPQTSICFTSLALGMRYQAPVTIVRNQGMENMNVSGDSPVLTLKSLQEQFPMFKTKQSLQTKSHRVQENIVRGFEIHKLTGALNYANKVGDTAAAEKIRQALDQYDAMDDLPTIPIDDDTNGTNHKSQHNEKPDDDGDNPDNLGVLQ